MSFSRPRTVLRVMGISLLVLSCTVTCKKLGELHVPATNPNPPEGPLPPAQPTGSVIVGVPNSPTPTQPPTSSPTASPVPTQPPGAGSCSLPSLPDGSPCGVETPTFQGQVEAAQADVLRTRPDLFDGGSVRSEDAYVQEVVRLLRTRGLCAAQGGPKDEIAVKTTNDWNDQYDIVLGSGQTWTSYQVTCRPARF